MAISNITLISGSNPVFGLNTLGGVLAIQTKNGREHPGSEIQASGDSFGRGNAQAETGGSQGDFDYFLTGNYFHEDDRRNCRRRWYGRPSARSVGRMTLPPSTSATTGPTTSSPATGFSPRACSGCDDDLLITVHPGDRIPLIPRHTRRLVLDYAVTGQWDVGAKLIASFGACLHGNEKTPTGPGTRPASATRSSAAAASAATL